MVSLARSNLLHDKVRFAVTIVGIVFAVVLITVQTGLFIGFTRTTSHIIDNSGAELWVMARGVRNFEVGSPISERKLYQALATPGVAGAEKYIVQFTRWKRNDGGEESIAIVGFDTEARLGAPWQLAAGSIADLKSADAIMIDESYREKLGVKSLGQTVEINNQRARVVGFTRGIRSFTTSPFVFTSFKNAQIYAPRVREDQCIYVLVKTAAGVDVRAVQAELKARLQDVDVYTTPEFSGKTRVYWMFTTGAGVAILVAALMGLIVGVVVVAQTIYATTVDHLKEFGTLKAMGATNGYIYRVIIKQAFMSATIGYLLGMALSLLAAHSSARSGAAIALPVELVVGMFALTLLMCVVASIVSINKVTHIDPAMVFKG